MTQSTDPRKHQGRYRHFLEESLIQLKIALPIIGFVGLFEIILVSNTMAAGRIDSETLATIGVSQSIWLLIFLVFQGFASAINPLIAATDARNDINAGQLTLTSAFFLIIIAGLCALVLGQYSELMLPIFGLEPQTITNVSGTVDIMAWALPAMCLVFAIRYFYEGISRTKPLMYIQLVVSLLHLFLIWRFVSTSTNFADAHLEIARITVISLNIQAVLALLWILRDKKIAHWRPSWQRLRPNYEISRQLVRVGLPIALLILAETSMFMMTNILSARLHPDWTAAHVVTMSHLYVIYLIPLSISNAISVRVARAKATQNFELIALRGYVGIGLGCIVLLLSGLTLWLIPQFIARVYTTESIVIQYAASLMGIAALFQLFDAIQVTTVGALRGLTDTFIPSTLAIFAYWGIGAPSLIYLAFNRGMGAHGLWLGLLIGLVAASSLLLGRWHYLTLSRNRVLKSEI